MPLQFKENAEIGIVFPLQSDGKRSSIVVGTDIVSAAALGSVRSKTR
jgi:hypothetical protein